MPETEAVVAQYTEKLSRLLDRVVPTTPTEADFRRPVDQLLEQFCEAAGLQPLSHTEYTVKRERPRSRAGAEAPEEAAVEYSEGRGRADSVFNRFVIEYKRPGVLAGDLGKTATQKATEQLVDYLRSIARQQRHEARRMGGVVFDGIRIIFVRVHEGRPVVEPPADAKAPAIRKMLEWMVSLSGGIALTPENLVNDFSIQHIRTQRILRALKQSLDAALAGEESLVGKLFAQWRLFFSEAIDYQEAFGGRKLAGLRDFTAKAGIAVKDADDAERFFFCLHTYFALLVKLLAWLALSRHLGAKLGAPIFGQLATLSDDQLRTQLQEMEAGGIFRQYGLVNLLEGDFFSWYLTCWDERLVTELRGMLARLSDYEPETLTVHPEETRDLFKKLYHYLLPREVRHNLGEYYTPDWLAERLLRQVDNDFLTADPARPGNRADLRRKLRELRWLDPACGSGTFPILLIRRYIELGAALMIPEADLLEWITANIVGFDLNPLAVMTARVNYLLAIAELLEHRRGEVTIPIYLADSIATPSLGEDLFSAGAYKLKTAVGEFEIPAEVFKADLDGFCALLEVSVDAELSTKAFLSRVAHDLGLDLSGQSGKRLAAVYDQVLDLHRSGFNGLWARIIKNNFAPLTVGRFDYIVGNPPWVNWANLPDAYRKTIAPLWMSYEIFPHKGFDAILGSANDDVSVLMTYVVIDRMLDVGGRLGFVITQSVFKTAGGGQGFRRLCIPQPGGTYLPLKVVCVDDMVDLQPFEGASNRTAVVIIQKGEPTRFPVPYTLWRRRPDLPRGQVLTYESTL